MNFSEKVYEQRKALHLTQQELADAIGVSKRAVAAYENENVLPRARTMRKLANVLMVSYDYLSNEEIDDPASGLGKDKYLETVEQQYGARDAEEVDRLLRANENLFAGGDLDEEAKDAFYQAVTKAYLLCKMQSRKKSHRPEEAVEEDRNDD